MAPVGDGDGGSSAEGDAIGAICCFPRAGRCRDRDDRASWRAGSSASTRARAFGLMSGLMIGLTSSSGCGGARRRELGRDAEPNGASARAGTGAGAGLGEGGRRMSAEPFSMRDLDVPTYLSLASSR